MTMSVKRRTGPKGSRPSNKLSARLRKVEALYHERRFDRADQEAAKLLKALPGNADLMTLRARIARALKQHQQAVTWARRAQRIAPGHKLAASMELKALSDMDDMETAYRRATELMGGPNGPELRLLWAQTLMDRLNFLAALDVLNEGLSMEPTGRLCCMLGQCFEHLHKLDQAMEAYELGTKIAPGDVTNFIRRATLAKMRGQVDARVYWLEVLQLQPDNSHALAEFLWSSRKVFDWDSFRRLEPEDYTKIRESESEANPWFFLSLDDNPESSLNQVRRLQNSRLRKLGLDAPERAPQPPPQAKGKIRVGYYSNDFHNHATLKLMSGLLREHDREKFELHCFDFGKNDASSSETLVSFDAVHRVNFMTDRQITDLSRSLGIEIAVDLKGETAGNRISLFLLGQAPVQINYLGYPGTLGTPAYDYIIGDPVLIPPGFERFYDEKIMRLPTCYLPADDRRRATLPPTRTQLGLPDDALVLACLNDPYKISAELFEIWVEALQAEPRAVLWLLDTPELGRNNILAEAHARGLDPERIIFARRLNHAAHVTRLAQADLYLDTFTCNAHTLAADAVCGANLPLLTCAGQQFAARVGASFITAAGLPELVCDTAEQYRETLLSLVKDPKRLLELRGRLAQNRANLPIFSSRRYTRLVERAYCHAHARAQAGQAPATFDVAPDTSISTG